MTASDAHLEKKLSDLGLSDLDIVLCEASLPSKRKLVARIVEYDDIFSRHSLDSGEAEGFVHCIHLTNDQLFRMSPLLTTNSSGKSSQTWKRRGSSINPSVSMHVFLLWSGRKMVDIDGYVQTSDA